MYDVAIIGLGPAGSFLAKHLNSTLKVIAIDKKKKEENNNFSKPCGGLLAPDAQKILSRFDMTLQKDILVNPQIFSVKTIDIKNDLIRYYQRFYINLDRHKFDCWLIEQIPDTVEVHQNATVIAIEKENDFYNICYKKNNKKYNIQSKYLVGADGAFSFVRRKMHSDFKIHAYLSIQEWFLDVHETPFYSCVFDSDLTDSYAWGVSKDEYFIFGGAFPIETAKQDFREMKEKLKKYGFHFGEPKKVEACLVLRPKGINNFCCGEQGVFLVGEAAGFISPSSLEGISYAIESGYLLAQCLNKNGNNVNQEYVKATRKIRWKLFLKNIKRPFMYHPLLRKIVMKSGITAIHKK